MVNQARAGFTLVEVVVSLVLLAVALLGLAAVATLAAASLHTSLVQERATRHAAGLLDSLTFSGGAGAGEELVEGVRYRWSAAGGPGAEIRVTATLPGPKPLVLEFTGRRIPVPGGAQP